LRNSVGVAELASRRLDDALSIALRHQLHSCCGAAGSVCTDTGL
jgi:hypothetical protein